MKARGTDEFPLRSMAKFLLAALGLVAISAGLAAADPPAYSLSPDLLGRIDQVFSESMEKYEIPGGVIAIVQDGEIVRARGFGIEDLERKRPIDPERTLFYLASLTKSFTATAVMQLVEKGVLDLNRDVNDYLVGFQVPGTFDEPITVHQLLTHTAGFDDRNIGYVAPSADEATPMGDYLATNLPRRVMPPGEVISYSNHGYGLAGYLVEVVSGERFEDYLENHVLEPLGMFRSTAHIPPPPTLANDVATGYFYNSQTDRMEPHLLGARNIPPAGTVIASATDVARFMSAQLSHGSYQGVRILDEDSTRIQQSRQFAHHPKLPGIAYGFYERYYNGHRAIEHAGGYPGWSTLMTLIPEKNIGIFMATNQGTSAPHYAALEVLLVALWGEPATIEPITPTGDATRLRRFRGDYQPVRYSRNSVEKLAIFDTQIKVRVDDDGYLTTASRTGTVQRWVEVEPLLFRGDDSDQLLAFRENDKGEVTYMFRSSGQLQFPTAYERLGWLDRISVQLPYLLVAASIFVACAVLWPIMMLGNWFVRRHRSQASLSRTPQRAAATIAIGISVLLITFIGGLDALLGNSLYRTQLAYGMTTAMRILLSIPILTTTLTTLVIWFAFDAWRKRWWTFWERAWYSVVAATMASFAAFLLNWRLLGFWY